MMIRLMIIIAVAVSFISCWKIKDYFRKPDTQVLTETIHSATLCGYAANLAMSVMNGQSYPFVTYSGSHSVFPCTSLMIVDLDESDYNYTTEKAGTVTIAGLWADANTAIFSLLFTDYKTGSNTIDLVGIETIPVIRDGDNIHVVMASQDIRLSPNQQSILTIDLNTLEIQSEYLRLEMPRPSEVYVAVLQNAYFIDISCNGTYEYVNDDDYTITGGGQLIEVAGNSAEIVQQAMVDVRVSSACPLNPVNGMALMKVTGLESEGFPELGTAVFEFTNHCDGEANVIVATGMYIGSNGNDISFHL